MKIKCEKERTSRDLDLEKYISCVNKCETRDSETEDPGSPIRRYSESIS